MSFPESLAGPAPSVLVLVGRTRPHRLPTPQESQAPLSGDGEEVVAVPAGALSAALGERERD